MTKLRRMEDAPKDGKEILIWGESTVFTGQAQWIVGKPDIKAYGWIDLPEEPKLP